MLAGISFVTDVLLASNYSRDVTTAAIILSMLLVGGSVRFVQELRSKRVADRLTGLMATTVPAWREGRWRELPSAELVVGDRVRLSAGDRVPADLRLTAAAELFVTQSVLTGESVILEKTARPLPKSENRPFAQYDNIAFMGSAVVGGSGEWIVLAVGPDTVYGGFSAGGPDRKNGFDRGANSIAWVLIRFMMVMVPLVFFLNGLTEGDWLAAFLFAISIAVGLTPALLPMVTSACLAKGAVSMSREKTIVKNLNSIQNFGAIDILCTDKTGTLTQDQVVLEYHMDVMGKDDLRVLRHAYLNSYFQTGYKNLMDLAIIRKTEEAEARDPRLTDLSEHYVKVDEIPFDFTRRRLTTVVQDKAGKTQMVTKGAVEEMLAVCSFAEYDGQVRPLTRELRERILATVDGLNEKGFRVLALAQKNDPAPVGAFGPQDEREMVLLEKDLMVLEKGILEGRKTYANMIKYIKMTASSNFGNMFSVLAASALLPFLPMMSLQLIFLNLIYDLSCTAIPWDNVDEEFLKAPRRWDASSVGSFMIWLGPTSSIFDFLTYIFMYFVFCPRFVSGGVLYNDLVNHFSGAQLAQIQTAYIALFQAGWFVESMWSQTLVIHMIRTPKIPFIQSRASAPLTLLTCTGIAVLTAIPFTPLGGLLGFAALPVSYFAYLIPCILLYMVLATSLKKAYEHHYGELL